MTGRLLTSSATCFRLCPPTSLDAGGRSLDLHISRSGEEKFGMKMSDLSDDGNVRQLQFRAGAEPLSVCARCCRLHSGQAFTDVPPVRGAAIPAGAAPSHSFLTLFSLYDSLRLLVHPGRAPRARYNNNRRQTSCASASRQAAANERAGLTGLTALHQ